MTDLRMARPDKSEYLPYYDRYVTLVPKGDILTQLSIQLDSMMNLLRDIPEARAGFRYQPDKWSIRELVGHVLDSERVFAYRALRFARNDTTPLEGYEQDDYVRNASFDTVPLEGLTNELKSVRQSTIFLFSHLEPEAWTRRGLANDAEVSVRALAWIIAGHGMYHEGMLRSRYLEGSS